MRSPCFYQQCSGSVQIQGLRGNKSPGPNEQLPQRRERTSSRIRDPLPLGTKHAKSGGGVRYRDAGNVRDAGSMVETFSRTDGSQSSYTIDLLERGLGSMVDPPPHSDNPNTVVGSCTNSESHSGTETNELMMKAGACENSGSPATSDEVPSLDETERSGSNISRLPLIVDGSRSIRTRYRRAYSSSESEMADCN